MSITNLNDARDELSIDELVVVSGGFLGTLFKAAMQADATDHDGGDGGPRTTQLPCR